MHVVNGCDQWVWSMAVSIGGGFTGKPHHEVSLFLLSVSFFAASFLLPSFFVKICFRSCVYRYYPATSFKWMVFFSLFSELCK